MSIYLLGNTGNFFLGTFNFVSTCLSQAPQPSSFDHFWHLVIQEKVEVILMVTQLVEGFNRKADQFWPEVGDEVKVGGGVKVTHKASYNEGIFTIRQFVILLPDGDKHEVTQVQPEDWADLGTEDGPRQLFEVLQRTNQMWRSSTGPMIVLFLDALASLAFKLSVTK